MPWSNHIKPYLDQLLSETRKQEFLAPQRIMHIVDYTSLNENDTAQHIADLCEKATRSFAPAGICVYPQFIKQVVRETANSGIRVATVANFPDGEIHFEPVKKVILQALEDGANELDVVFPYRAHLAGEQSAVADFVKKCKAACGSATLKMILETGAYPSLGSIARASQIALEAGADFIKTSTGKIAKGASLEAAAVMLLVIKALMPHAASLCGLKVSGGIREISQAEDYLILAKNIMGKAWITPQTFRIGASQLVDRLISSDNT